MLPHKTHPQGQKHISRLHHTNNIHFPFAEVTNPSFIVFSIIYNHFNYRQFYVFVFHVTRNTTVYTGPRWGTACSTKVLDAEP